MTAIQVGAKGADYVKLTDPIKAWLTANAVTFVLRYCVPLESTRIGKAITVDEIRWLHAHRIAVMLNWEVNTSDGLGGATAGRRNGLWLKARALELGCPTFVPLIASIDTDTHAGNLGANTAYMRAFAAAILPYPVGVYGDSTIAWAVRDLNPFFWRANATAWGAVKPGQIVHVQQHHSITPPGVDPNTCRNPFPAWLPAPPPPPPPTIDPAIGASGDEMLFCYIDANGTAWIGNGLARRVVADMDEFAQLAFLSATGGGPVLMTANGATVTRIEDVAHVGPATIEALGKAI